MIPKHIHRIWVGDELPREFREYGEEWRRLHPDWRMTLWSYRPFADIKNVELLDKAKVYQPRDWKRFYSDVLRYEILLKFGGVYFDTDSKPLRPLDPLLEGVTAFTAYSPNPGPHGEKLANNGSMGCEPGHPFFQALVDELPAWVEAHRGERTAVMCGPYFVSTVLASREWPDLTVFEPRIFYPYSLEDRRRGRPLNLDGAYTHHMWATSRDRKARKAKR